MMAFGMGNHFPWPAMVSLKGPRAVLEERDVNTWHMNTDKMCAVLANHLDFKNEKSQIVNRETTYSVPTP